MSLVAVPSIMIPTERTLLVNGRTTSVQYITGPSMGLQGAVSFSIIEATPPRKASRTIHTILIVSRGKNSTDAERTKVSISDRRRKADTSRSVTSFLSGVDL